MIISNLLNFNQNHESVMRMPTILKTSSLARRNRQTQVMKVFEQLMEQDHKISYNLLEYIKQCVFCKKCGSRKKLEQLSFGQQIINQRIDIVYILNKLVEIDKLKCLLLTQDQIRLFDFLPKPQISDTSINQAQNGQGQSIPPAQQLHPQVFMQKWNLLSKNKPLIEKARAAYNVFKRLMTNKTQTTKTDLRLLDMLDNRIRYYFEKSAQIDLRRS